MNDLMMRYRKYMERCIGIGDVCPYVLQEWSICLMLKIRKKYRERTQNIAEGNKQKTKVHEEGGVGFREIKQTQVYRANYWLDISPWMAHKPLKLNTLNMWSVTFPSSSQKNTKATTKALWFPSSILARIEWHHQPPSCPNEKPGSHSQLFNLL